MVAVLRSVHIILTKFTILTHPLGVQPTLTLGCFSLYANTKLNKKIDSFAIWCTMTTTLLEKKKKDV